MPNPEFDKTRVWAPQPGSASAPPPAAASPPPTPAGPSPEFRILEKKLGALRLLLLVCLAANLVTVGALISTSNEVTKTRRNLIEMNSRAEDAIMRLAPELGDRLKKMDTAMARLDSAGDQIDSKMHAAEDKFVARIQTEFPRIADQYLDKKMKAIPYAVK